MFNWPSHLQSRKHIPDTKRPILVRCDQTTTVGRKFGRLHKRIIEVETMNLFSAFQITDSKLPSLLAGDTHNPTFEQFLLIFVTQKANPCERFLRLKSEIIFRDFADEFSRLKIKNTDHSLLNCTTSNHQERLCGMKCNSTNRKFKRLTVESWLRFGVVGLFPQVCPCQGLFDSRRDK